MAWPWSRWETLVFRNSTEAEVSIWVEPYSLEYRIPPGASVTIRHDRRRLGGEPVSIDQHADGIMLWAAPGARLFLGEHELQPVAG